MVTMQEVYRIEAFLAVDVYQVTKVPAYQIVESEDAAHGYVSCIIAMGSADDRVRQVKRCQVFHLGSGINDALRLKRLLKNWDGARGSKLGRMARRERDACP
jgi:hypothetical protein